MQSIPENRLRQLIGNLLAVPVKSLTISGVGGGSINQTHRLVINNNRTWFLKSNSVGSLPGLFEKEKEGLQFLSSQHVVKVPLVIYNGIIDDQQLLLLEWIQPGARTGSFWKKFGEQLAQLHHCTNEQFGFMHDNYMGALPQANTFTDSWTEFFTQHRLVPQTQLATSKGLLNKSEITMFEKLYLKLDTIFNTEPPSLLHGDLWSGNYMCNINEEPVLIDPAVYYGHRSIDLAMTTLFGGFDMEFYTSYHYHFPLPSNYEEQWAVCNLYPLLIHLNLFGQSYRREILETLQKYA